MTLYRGAKLRKKDFDSLKPGTFIEMYGFMSTSKSMKRAEMFTDNEGYIIVVHVRERVMSAKILAYDHGFVDINRNKLASGSYEQEE